MSKYVCPHCHKEVTLIVWFNEYHEDGEDVVTYVCPQCGYYLANNEEDAFRVLSGGDEGGI